MQVYSLITPLPGGLIRNMSKMVLRPIGHDSGITKLCCLVGRFFTPATGNDIVGRVFGAGKIHGRHCHLQGCAALREQHTVVIWHAEKLA